MPNLEDLFEPDVTINGQALTFSQSMALRVAVSTFRITLSDKQFRRGLGDQLARNYDERLREVEDAMLRR
jgi:hypothetical protein